MTPISVAKVGDDKYHVVDGWRRTEAMKKMGMVKVSCLVYEGLKDADAAHKSYVLNTERNQLNEIEVALHIKKMRDDFGYTFQELEILDMVPEPICQNRLNFLICRLKFRTRLHLGF